MMKKTILPLLLFCLFPLFSFADHHNEGDMPVDTVGFTPSFRLASILDFGDFDFHTSISGDFNHESPDVYELQALLYYRVLKNLKAGVFYKLQMGQRHDDDWVKDAEGNWIWEDSRTRLENIAGVDLTPRMLLPFLPGRSWVLSSKVRYSYNFFNQNQKILLRPELSYFLMKDRKPRWHFSTAYGIYFPLNFSDRIIYEHGPYLTVSRYIGTDLILSLFGEYKIRYWTSSEEYIAAGGTYDVNEQKYKLGLSLIWKTGF